MAKVYAYNSTKRIGKTHIGRLLRFPKEGGLTKHKDFKDDDLLYYSMFCGIGGENYEQDLEDINNIDSDNICRKCFLYYRVYKQLCNI